MSLPICKLSLRFTSVLLLILAIAVLLRIINLGQREFWYDEVLSLLLATGQKIAYEHPQNVPVVLADYTALLRLPTENGLHDIVETLKNLLRGLAGGEPHPPLFFLSQHLWLRLLGNGEAAMRSLGALWSVVAIGSAYGFGRYLLGQRGGLLFAALLGTNPYYMFHSLNVRMYGLLVLWTILSAWAMLRLIDTDKLVLKHRSFLSHILHHPPNPPYQGENRNWRLVSPKNNSSSFRWSVLLICSVTAGLLTFYLFAYFLLALIVLVVFFNRSRSHLAGWCLGASVLLTIPWMLWGTRQQLRNADLERFSTSTNFVETVWRHLQDVVQTLGIHLVLGDWISSLPPISATVAGVVAMLVLVTCSISLWRQNQRRVLGIALILGIFPLLLGLAVDVVSGKFTIAFGWGRAMIFILPGCLLLLTAWIEKVAGQRQRAIAVVLLLLYLSLSVADFTTRQRWMFHQVADMIEQDSTTPTLIVMNSQAWGHVLRLAYYIPPTWPVMLLAEKSANLAPVLEKSLSSEPTQYQRILWLDSAQPVWSPPSTEAEKAQIRQVLESQFQLEKTQQLSGSMELDQFIAHLYQR